MKTIKCYAVFMGIIFIISMMTGCNGDGDTLKDEAKEAVQEAAEPQNVSGPEAPQAARRVS
ncbi:MAG TPA: hypothetical protein VJ373_06955 [Desulfatiglandales bacterium]|nr:hypothetical protein [Desulfatiglandales bacterium]